MNPFLRGIERNRDHGIPSYYGFRELYELPKIMDFNDLEEFMLPDVYVHVSKTF